MKRLLQISGFLSLCLLLVACPKDDAPGPVEARPHAEVYPEDLLKIEEYLQTHYLDVADDNASGDLEVDKGEIDIKLIDAGQVSIWDQTEYPLLNKMVKLHGVDFKVYYLKLDGKGDTDADGDKPCGVDRVMVKYKGLLLDGTQFDYSPNEVEFNLIDLVKGWEYIMPLFRGGESVLTGDGTLDHSNFGAGIMFLPSGLGYYNSSVGAIPTYSPLIFSFNLMGVTYLDQDFDNIPSRYEYAVNEDGTLLDTDTDNIPDVFDADDDNDGYLTKDEIKHTVTVTNTVPDPDTVTTYTYTYPFDGAAVNDPVTPYLDETQGIPTCDDPRDYTTPTRVRRHLDRNCFIPIHENITIN